MENLKAKLIERINANEDEALLKELYDLLTAEEQEPLHLDDEAQHKIRESEAQYESGKTLSDAEVQKKLNHWLDK